ncbi:MAG: LAGLIDADG family homing endonuclease [Planctomycetota bacterium]
MSCWYDTVPRDKFENLRYRHELRKTAAFSEKHRRMISQACQEDVLYFFGAVCWLFEPRPKIIDGKKQPKVIPFIPWPHQEDAIREIDQHLGHEDVGVEKSRGEGMSWIAVYFAVRDFIFEEYSKVGIVSRNEDMADDPDNTDSLGWKCLEVSTPVLTTQGWKPISEIGFGDEVYGSSGKPVKVVRALESHLAECVEMEFSDGTKVICTEDHLWPANDCNDRMNGSRYKSGSMNQYRDVRSDEMMPVLKKNKHWNWQIKPTPIIEFPEQDHLIPPYTLGVLIGDGCLTKSGIEFASIDDEVVERVRSECIDGTTVNKGHGIVWFLSKLKRSSKPNPYSVELNRLGLRGKKAAKKSVPDCYKFGSREQRLELIRGLMDTDGTVKRSGSPYLSTTSRSLAHDMMSLVRSLGGFSSLRQYTKPNGTVEYRVSVSIPSEPVFHLKRKQDAVSNRSQTVSRRVVSIRSVGKREVKCITVNADDGLFVTDGCLLTHNCDFGIQQLPPWMSGERDVDWKRNRGKHTWVNLRNGASIAAGAATGDVFRGGRLTWAMMDEFAFFKKKEDSEALNSSHGATNSRLFISTVNGQNNEYYHVMHEPSSMVKVIIDWKQNVSRNRGLYMFKEGLPVAVDPENNPLPKHYDPPTQEVLDLFSRLRAKGYRLEGKERSPWYDHECDRPRMTPQRIAQELDRDYAGSSFLVFGDEFNKVIQETTQEPVHTGNFIISEDTTSGQSEVKAIFSEVRNGPVDLWLPLDARGKPPFGSYALSADISHGLGGSHTSNSTLVGTDLSTHEQILAFASNTIEPSEFANLAVALAEWLGGAYLGWEANGSAGAAFTKRVLTLRYGNVYRRKSQKKRGRRETKELGFWTDQNTKGVMFSEITRAVLAGDVVVRDRKLGAEFKQYIVVNSKIEHAQSLVTEDESSKGQAHGDRVIALGVNCQMLLDRPNAFVGREANDIRSQNPNKPPPGTMAERMRIYAEEDAAKKGDPDGWKGSVLSR